MVRDYRVLGANAIGERFGRTQQAIQTRARVLGVARKIGGPHREPAMMAQIAAVAANTSYGMAARKYGITRNMVAAIVRDAPVPKPRTMRTALRRWTKREDTTVVAMYREYGATVLAERLSRTVGAVEARALRLGVARKNSHPYRHWLPAEDEYVRKRYRIDGSYAVAVTINRSWRSVQARARAIGVAARGRGSGWRYPRNVVLAERLQSGA